MISPSETKSSLKSLLSIFGRKYGHHHRAHVRRLVRHLTRTQLPGRPLATEVAVAAQRLASGASGPGFRFSPLCCSVTPRGHGQRPTNCDSCRKVVHPRSGSSVKNAQVDAIEACDAHIGGCRPPGTYGRTSSEPGFCDVRTECVHVWIEAIARSLRGERQLCVETLRTGGGIGQETPKSAVVRRIHDRSCRRIIVRRPWFAPGPQCCGKGCTIQVRSSVRAFARCLGDTVSMTSIIEPHRTARLAEGRRMTDRQEYLGPPCGV